MASLLITNENYLQKVVIKKSGGIGRTKNVLSVSTRLFIVTHGGNMFTIAGIGSRDTPKNILKEMKTIGEWCRINGVTVRSGHADGADWAFESGAQDLCVAYIPWNGFNSHFISDASIVIPEYTKELVELAEQFHPAWEKLTHGAKKLIARDGLQVLGSDLKTPVNMVVCWTKGGKAVGGTGQAIRIAEANRIPVANMFGHMFDSSDKVIREIEAFKNSAIVMGQ